MKRVLAALIVSSCAALAQNPAVSDAPAQEPNVSDTLGTAELLLLKLPAVIPSPFDFGQMARQKLPVFSLEEMSWTASRFQVEGMTATDPYQPGRPVRVSAEFFNVLNLGASLRVADLTGPQFLQNLPREMQPPRFARGGISWEF
jgi:hypothetical protein